MVAHVSMADPVCPRLSALAAEAARAAGAIVHPTGTYLAMEGPQFSTRAESRLYRQWGCDLIGMTAMPEAKLAREAELPYAIVAMVTDYDCWHPDHDHVTVDAVVKIMHANAEHARKLIMNVSGKLGPMRTPSPAIENVLDTALMTAPDKRDVRLMRKLGVHTRTELMREALHRGVVRVAEGRVLRPGFDCEIFQQAV